MVLMSYAFWTFESGYFRNWEITNVWQKAALSYPGMNPERADLLILNALSVFPQSIIMVTQVTPQPQQVEKKGYLNTESCRVLLF